MKKKSLTEKGITIAMLITAGLFILISVITLIARSSNSSQSSAVYLPKIRLVGEYSIAGGEWRPIRENEHISACKGDVKLRGYLELYNHETGEIFGRATEGGMISFNLNHIHMTAETDYGQIFVSDIENPYIGEDACGNIWGAFDYEGAEGEITFTLYNNHSMGNENAVDSFLDSMYVYAEGHFESSMRKQGIAETAAGIIVILFSFIVIGIGVFSAALRLRLSRRILLGGLLVFFGGVFIIMNSPNYYFTSELVIFNTLAKGLSFVLYMLLFFILSSSFLPRSLRRWGNTALIIYSLLLTGIMGAVIFKQVYFYDTISARIALTSLVGIVFLVLSLKCLKKRDNDSQRILVFTVAGIIAYLADAAAMLYGWWRPGLISSCVFLIACLTAMVVFLGIVPESLKEAERAKSLEAEKAALDAKLAESRISTMISQIRPHFIYNTLGSIEQLCELEPEAAAKLVNNFAKYLRGNFGELDKPRLIRVSREMEHTKYYTEIERVRFPDISFSLEIGTDDFSLPALTIQPIVENAIKHGIMKRSRGGQVRVRTYETENSYCVSVEDDGVGFDVNELRDDSHIGLRNIRGRLEAMCDGVLTVESRIGEGTKVVIEIPKEATK